MGETQKGQIPRHLRSPAQARSNSSDAELETADYRWPDKDMTNADALECRVFYSPLEGTELNKRPTRAYEHAPDICRG